MKKLTRECLIIVKRIPKSEEDIPVTNDESIKPKTLKMSLCNHLGFSSI